MSFRTSGSTRPDPRLSDLAVEVSGHALDRYRQRISPRVRGHEIRTAVTRSRPYNADDARKLRSCTRRGSGDCWVTDGYGIFVLAWTGPKRVTVVTVL